MYSEDFLITEDDILAAIGDLKSDSAAGPDGIPVILLKNCATELCEPLRGQNLSSLAWCPFPTSLLI